MGKKIRQATVIEWLTRGNVEMLDKYWKHPEMVVYRASQMARNEYQKTDRNIWCESIWNGKTFLFLLERDPDVQRAHRGLARVDYWSNIFFERCWRDSWTLLDIGPERLRSADALETLDLLMRANHHENGGYETVRNVRAKIHNEVHAFYRKFEHRYPLTALAWIDNEQLWTLQRPMMANLMRHAASHHPQDVLGAYLMWSHDAPFMSEQSESERLTNNALRMSQLRDLAGRVGLDTSSYDDHSQQSRTLYAGLGIELTAQAIVEYVQSISVPAAPMFDDLDTPSLFS